MLYLIYAVIAINQYNQWAIKDKNFTVVLIGDIMLVYIDIYLSNKWRVIC